MFRMRKWHCGHLGSLKYSFKCVFVQVSLCPHPGAEYQKVYLAQGWGVCLVKAHYIHSIHWEQVAGRSTVGKKREG